MRAPLDIGLFNDCFKQLQHYVVRVGDGFSVNGSASGYITDYQPNPVTRICEAPPELVERVRLRRSRIPLDAPACAPGTDALTWLGPNPTNTNVCIVGASTSTNVCTPTCTGSNVCQADGTCVAPDRVAPALPTDDRVLHFENPVLSFALHLPLNPTGFVPADETTISFVVVGGGFPLGLQLGIASATPAQSPKSMVVAPDNQTVFVVDEGKGAEAIALRGQLLRLVSEFQICDPAFRVR